MSDPTAIVPHPPFWTQTSEALAAQLQAPAEGLTGAEARDRLARYGPNSDRIVKADSAARAIARRLLEPLAIILLIAGLVSVGTGDVAGGTIIILILMLSIGLDTFQEGQAVRAAEVLRQSVALKAEVLRDGAYVEINVDQVVPGDRMRVRAGDIVPADALILDSTAFTANEASLTGEPYAVEKHAGMVTALSASEAVNALFRGSVAETGEAVALVAGTGPDTVFGAAAAALSQDQTLSPFQRDLHDYGVAVARLTMGLVLAVLAARVLLGQPMLDSLLFSVALAVGLTPELLPMITTVTLSRGAIRMAGKKVIVKRLASIHDLGAMSILCTDKTGTLTSAEISLTRSTDFAGTDQSRAAQLAAIAASLGGDRGSLDAALMRANPDAATGWTLLGRLSFNFASRRGAVLAGGAEGAVLIVKGAPESVLPLCSGMRTSAGPLPMDAAARDRAGATVAALAGDGLRAVAVSSRPFADSIAERGAPLDNDDLADMIFEGFAVFADPPKPTAAAAIKRLADAGIRLKILSGDDPVVVRRLANLVGLKVDRVLSGPDIAAMSDAALSVQVRMVHAYGRLAPDQKSRIVRALQTSGHVVGFLGDGINDAPALRLADIGLSVEGASGVAQAAADMILLQSDLEVVADGVEEGRRTFANILKYIRMGASSNFGNMVSMALASLILPFLPMLPVQILVNNLLYDFSEIGIPFDAVRREATAKPQVWDMGGIIRFAGIMGPLSSLFDLLTFGLLILVFHASPEEFRTTWFLESMATQILVIFIIRTGARPWRDLPRPWLTASSLTALALAIALPFTPVGRWFGFVVPPSTLMAGIGVLVVAYLVLAETLKGWAMAPSRHARGNAAARRRLRRQI